MKKITSLFAVLAMLATLFVVPVSAETDYAGGDGTAATPYQIATKEQLANMAAEINAGTNNNAYFELTADIDYGNAEWTPIGNVSWANSFKGSFDGKGHVIKNIKITGTPSYEAVGLFCYVGNDSSDKTTTIKNLGIENMTISVNGSTVIYAGGLAGYVHAYTTIENCYVKNSSVCYEQDGYSHSSLRVGSFAGRVRNANGSTSNSTAPLIKNCYSYNVELRCAANKILGGFAGALESNYDAKFENCYAAGLTYDADFMDGENHKGTVYGFANGGGLEGTTASNCYSALAGGKGSASNALSYTAANEIGTAGAAKSAITGYFETVEGFAVSPDVNDGYPCFTREVPENNPLYAAGIGTEERPYEIATKEQLANMATEVNAGRDNNAYFVLTADIDYGNAEWTPIGNVSWANSFKGSFDGQGHVIKNLKVTGSPTYAPAGLFGYVGTTDGSAPVSIKNLGIENMELVVSGNTVQYAGGLAGIVHVRTTIENCYVKNSKIQFAQYAGGSCAVGGFVGVTRTTSWHTTNAPLYKNCYVYGVEFRASTSSVFGGFAGYVQNNYGGAFENCFVAGTTYAAEFLTDDGTGTGNRVPRGSVYGFVNDKNNEGIEVKNCYSTIESVKGFVGGLYDETQNAGITGASQSAIVNAFEGVTGFAVSPAVNGGYPCFTNEVPFKVTSVDSSDGTVKIARKAGVTTPATVYVATYDANDRFIDVATATVNADDFTFTPDGLATGAKIKAFVWGVNNNPLTYVD